MADFHGRCMLFPSAHPLLPCRMLVLYVSQGVFLFCSDVHLFLVSIKVLVLGTALSWGISHCFSHYLSVPQISVLCYIFVDLQSLYLRECHSLWYQLRAAALSGHMHLSASAFSSPLSECVPRHILVTASCNTVLCIYFFLSKNIVLLRVQSLSYSPSPLFKRKAWITSFGSFCSHPWLSDDLLFTRGQAHSFLPWAVEAHGPLLRCPILNAIPFSLCQCFSQDVGFTYLCVSHVF